MLWPDLVPKGFTCNITEFEFTQHGYASTPCSSREGQSKKVVDHDMKSKVWSSEMSTKCESSTLNSLGDIE